MVRKFILGVAVVFLPMVLVLGVAPGVASASSNPPTVNHIGPHGGPANGGTAVAITGANLTGATAVNFGMKSARTYHVVSHRVIIASSPSGTGVVDITVTTPNGTSATSSKDQFTYKGTVLPVVKNVVPGHGKPAGGGQPVTIIGDDLEGATAVNFGTNPGTDVTVYSHHLVTAVPPAGTGTVDVTVTTPLGTSAVTRKDLYTYNSKTLPIVTRVAPHRGSTGGGTPVVIHGSNLTGATVVDFGSNAATDVDVITSHLISATSPAGTGTVDVTVMTPNGTSAIDTGDEFVYASVGPVVTHVAPHKGTAAGGTVVAINGQNLAGTTVVDFGGNAATNVRVISPKVVLATSPSGTGTVDVTVTTPNGTSATSSKDQFTYK